MPSRAGATEAGSREVHRMAWLLQKETPQRELAERFRQLVKRGPVVLPGAHDALSALIAQRVGFEALYLSGAAYTASRGLPDLGWSRARSWPNEPATSCGRRTCR